MSPVDGPPPGIDQRGWWADRVWRPWINAVRPLADARVLEYGCGPGSVSRAFAPHVGHHIGLDIDEDYIAAARRMGAESGQDNTEFHAHPPDEIVQALRSYAGGVDVVLLYAVLEHLTMPERLQVLRAARDVARPHGIIAIVETPNRLASFDQHSSWLPFLTQLPDPLALEYGQWAPRPELHEHVLAVRDPELEADEDEEALLALARFGRGMSYHEVELAWGGRIDGHALATNWEPEVIPHREIHPGEVALARQVSRLRPELEPSWSRQWLDVILSPDLPVRRRSFHRPWVGHPGPASRLVSRDLGDVVFLPSHDATLHVELPEATRRVALRVVDGESRTAVHVETLSGIEAQGTTEGAPGEPVTVIIDLPEWSDDLLVSLPRGGWILGLTYVGYGPG